jgi:hypothetical protein
MMVDWLWSASKQATMVGQPASQPAAVESGYAAAQYSNSPLIPSPKTMITRTTEPQTNPLTIPSPESKLNLPSNAP